MATKKGKIPYSAADLMIIETMMAEGASVIEVAAKIGVHRKTVYEWAKKFKDFGDTLKRGQELSEAWWESQGRENLTNSKFNAVLWYMNMKNRFGWRDKQEVSTTVDFGDKLQELIEKLPG